MAEKTTSTPQLEMVYLGKEGGKTWGDDSGYMTGITGPWNAILPEELPDGTFKDAMEMGDIFWLGVKLDNATVENLPLEMVKSFTFTMVYDSQYVTPAVVLNEQMWNGAVTGGDQTTAQLAQRRWETMMSLYNLSASAKGHTVWADDIENNYQLTTTAGWGNRFTTHYSTAQVPLESAVSSMETTRLQSITFSVEVRDRIHAVHLQNSEEYIFVVPFQMIKHPFGQTTARLVEFEAGMRSITLVGTGGTAYAYSSQDAIFGGKTQNLKDGLSFANLGAEIPLGENNTPVYSVYNYNATGGSSSHVNGVYADEFMSGGGWIKKEDTEEEEFLPFTLGGQLSG
ncbi:MAG: hypothetical protein K2F83_05980, partial [Oscillospiraceae bacterium]|nr:hypothetical protein [Oscillospiraceae bacterium]